MRGIAKSGQNAHTLHGAVRTRRTQPTWKPGRARPVADQQEVPAKLRRLKLRRSRKTRTGLRRDPLLFVLLLIGVAFWIVYGEAFR